MAELTVGPYRSPPIKTRVTPILLPQDSCSLQTIGRGKTKMMTSEITFIAPKGMTVFFATQSLELVLLKIGISEW